MGHSLSKLKRHLHQNQTQNPSPAPPNDPSSSTPVIGVDNNSTFNGGFPAAATDSTFPSQPHASSYVFAANAPHPSSASPPHAPPFATSPSHYDPPSPSLMAPAPFFSSAPPPFVDHTSAKKIKNDVNIHKDTISLFLDDNNLDSHLVSFTFDALVDGIITIFYFAKEGPNCRFMSLYPEIYMPKKITFQKGLAQKFYQASGTGIDLGFFELGLLSKPSRKQGIFPLVISAEASLLSTTAAHAQITQAVLKQSCEGHFEVEVMKQILWIEGIRYELREIYGIENYSEHGFDGSDQSGKACVICMNEPKDTAVLPCRHMCMCSGCAKQLRLQSKRCPVCRHSIQELIEIKINNQPKPAV